ncbi:DUF397 domain-containing protein [Actinomadura macrotermitis]|uniref:DUF397 domain-containing protein n=1 Tax=Actinomadura macrotermitis TaxID=2585200 RepID=A0A7K0BTT9_9ACTN|nr:DUF397 domain-containing protein [Actinomadura macrotermitis]MQY04613.1 hypothetical protein [Actinomadura macrotermitis]
MAERTGRFTGLTWRKASASDAAGACVEVARSGDAVLVRDSRDRSGGIVEFPLPRWRDLVTGIRDSR